MKCFATAFLTLLLFVFSPNGGAQELRTESDSLSERNRRKVLIGTTTLLYTGTLIGLYDLWYEDETSSEFHLFDDSKQWLQMDKVGHSFSTYISAYYGIKAFQWAGYSKNTSIFLGGSIGFIFMGTVEVFDGYSDAWGFSKSDLLANGIGSAFAMSQAYLFDEQKMKLKYSYSPTKFRELRSGTLGNNELQGFLKDYNGQTYWLSANLNSLNSRVQPEWLSLAFGYGASNLLASQGSFEAHGKVYEPYRQYYLSLDADLEKIPTQKKWVKTVLTALNFIKLPFPAVEFNSKGVVKGHWLYF